jgi:molybdate/tungstate transport system substrate-binding protein
MTRGSYQGRRAFLAGGGAAAAGVAGCLALVGTGSHGRGARVALRVAGSLQHATTDGLETTVDVPLAVAANGSAAAARFVAEGQKDPDVLSLADVALFEDPLATRWYVEFAANALVVAYDRASAGGERVASAGTERWHEALLADEVALGRTDPDLDPLGYRTLFALDLAADHYGTDVDLRAAVPGRDQVYPETQLLAALETGAVDAAVVYRSMAVDRGYAFVDLPAQVDLGSPRLADRYATASYELPGGTVVEGDVISYGSTARRRSAAVDAVFEAQVAGEYLAEVGFTVPEAYPRARGDVPDAFSRARSDAPGGVTG